MAIGESKRFDLKRLSIQKGPYDAAEAAKCEEGDVNHTRTHTTTKGPHTWGLQRLANKSPGKFKSSLSLFLASVIIVIVKT